MRTGGLDIKNLYGYSGHIPVTPQKNVDLLLQNMVLEAQLSVPEPAVDEEQIHIDIPDEAAVPDAVASNMENLPVVSSDTHAVFRDLSNSSFEETPQGYVGISQSTFVRTAQAAPEAKRWWDRTI